MRPMLGEAQKELENLLYLQHDIEKETEGIEDVLLRECQENK